MISTTTYSYTRETQKYDIKFTSVLISAKGLLSCATKGPITWRISAWGETDFFLDYVAKLSPG